MIKGVNLGPSFWGSVELFANPLLNLLLVPILFAAYGADGYGTWVFMVSTSALGILGGLGAPGAATWLVAQARVDDSGVNFPKALKIIYALTFISFVTGVFVIAVFIAISDKAGIGLVGHIGTGFFVLFLPPVIFCAQQFDSVMSAILRGSDRYRELAMAEIGGKLVTGGLVLALTQQKAEMAFCMGFFAFAFVLSGLGKLLLIKADFRRSGHAAAQFMLADLWVAFGQAKWFWLQGASSVVFSSVDRIIVGSALGSGLLGVYAIATQIGGVALLFFSGVFQRLVTAAKRVQAKKSGQLLSDFFGKVLLINTVMSCLAAVVALYSVDYVLHFWLGNRAGEITSQPIRFLLLPFLMLTGTVAAHYSLTGLGILKQVGFLNIIGGLILVVSMTPLVVKYELMGAAAARAMYAIVFFYEWFLFYQATRIVAD